MTLKFLPENLSPECRRTSGNGFAWQKFWITFQGSENTPTEVPLQGISGAPTFLSTVYLRHNFRISQSVTKTMPTQSP